MSNVDNTMGQKPMEFRRRPLGVTAVWYMGGEGSGLEVAQWIRRNNGTAAFFASVPAWVHESGAEGYPEQSEKIAMETVSGFTYVEPGAWVAKDSNGQFHIYTSETFEREFVQTSFPDGVSMGTQPIKEWEALKEWEEKFGLEAFQKMVDGRRRLSEYEKKPEAIVGQYDALADKLEERHTPSKERSHTRIDGMVSRSEHIYCESHEQWEEDNGKES